MAEETTEVQAAEGALTPPPEEIEEGSEQANPVEALAEEMGWRPKENFNGDEADFVGAAQYIRKGQDIQDGMRKSLKDQKQQLSDMSVSLTELKQHNERVFKAEVGQLKKELNDLTHQKKAAIQDGNVPLVDELDEQIDTVKESMVPPEKVVTANPEGGDFDDWVKDNDWYNSDKEMATYADSVADSHKGAPFVRVAALVSRRVKEMFPDKFPAPRTNNAPNASRVEAGGRRATAGKFTKSDLSDSQKSIMQQFVRQGIMTEKQYVEDIAKVAGGAA